MPTSTIEKHGGVVAPGTLPPVDFLAEFYLQQNYALSGIISFSSRGMGTDDNLKASFERAIQTSPMLQCKVHQNEDGTKEYRRLMSKEDWPQVKIVYVGPGDGDDSVRTEEARQARERLQDEMMDPAAHCTSLRMVAIRGPPRTTFVFACPHHFIDGVGLGAMFVKIYQYARCPRILWPTLDKLSFPKDFIPSYDQVLFKSEYGKNSSESSENNDMNVSCSPRFDPNIFKFDKYNFMEEGAIDKLRGLTDDIADVPGKVLQRCVKCLRKKGITLSTAISALAAKTLAILLLRECGPDVLKQKKLLITNGMDLRPVGKWGVRKLDNHVGFPFIGNYTVAVPTLLGDEHLTERALQDGRSLEDIALLVKETFQRCRGNASLRLREKTALCSPDSRTEIFCGCSSVVLPRGLSRLCIPQALSFDNVTIQFGPIPRSWAYAVTCGSVTRLSVDIQLPIEGLTPEKTRAAVIAASKGSPLEQLVGLNEQDNNKSFGEDQLKGDSDKTWKIGGTHRSLSMAP